MRLPTAKTNPGLMLIVRASYFKAQGNGRISAWIVAGRMSRTTRTVYALGKTFRRIPGRCYLGCTHAVVGGLHYFITRLPVMWRGRRYRFDLARLLDLSEDEEE